MNKYKLKTIHILVIIFFLASFLRFIKLDTIPSGFHVDEAKIGWNSYSLLKTGRDDWENPFPIHYNTFGDFRPTGYMYAVVPAILMFGLNEFSIRLIPAIFGAISIPILFFLVRELSGNIRISLLSAIVLTISPWHLSLSRSGSEAIISLSLTMLGLFFFIKSIKKSQNRTMLLSTIFLSLSYFFYHTFRLITPLLLLITLLFHSWPPTYKNLFKKPVSVFIFLSFLSFIFILNPSARGRFSQVSVFNDLNIKYELQKLPFEEGDNKVFIARAFHNKIVLYSIRFITEYAKYFSSDFLIGSWGSKPLRYVTVNAGPLLYIEFTLLFLGLASFIKNKINPLTLLYLLIAPIASALTTEDTPNLNRSILMSPILSIFVALGIDFIYRSTPRFKKIVWLCILLNFVYFWHMYTIHNSKREEIAMNRNSGVRELIAKLPQLQKDYSLIYLTNIPDNLYPWYAFYYQPDPKLFNHLAKYRDKGEWKYQNLVFSEFKCPSGNIGDVTTSIAVVDSEGCVKKPVFTSLAEVTRSSGGVAYTIWGRK
jgi:4-amino-4-deoxy-L-arabinose transferase-like glycosyltransferase